MFTTRLVALTAACSLISLPAAASPYRLQLHSDTPGYAPAGTHEVVVQAVPVAPEVTEVAIIAPQPYADPTGPSTTTVIVTAPEQPPAPAAPPAPPPPPKRGLGMMITGWSMFTGIYLLTAWSGALIYDGSCDLPRPQCRDAGRALMVPFAGPIIATQHTDSARETFGLLLLSGVQIGTFLMGLVGAVRWSRYKRWERNFAGLQLGRSGLALQPIPRLDGGGLGLNYRF